MSVEQSDADVKKRESKVSIDDSDETGAMVLPWRDSIKQVMLKILPKTRYN